MSRAPRSRSRYLARALLLAPLAAVALAAEPPHAELGSPKDPAPAVVPIADPTRPPSGWGQPVAAASAAGGHPDAQPLQLASIRTGGNAPDSALISGRLVQVGDRVDGATVIAIGPNSATLRTATGLVRLLLAPEVVKSPMGTPNQLRLVGRKEAR